MMSKLSYCVIGILLVTVGCTSEPKAVDDLKGPILSQAAVIKSLEARIKESEELLKRNEDHLRKTEVRLKDAEERIKVIQHNNVQRDSIINSLDELLKIVDKRVDRLIEKYNRLEKQYYAKRVQ